MDDSGNRIEILSVSLLKTHSELVEEMRQRSMALNINLGWHYLLDLAWAARQLEAGPGMRLIDAGAGMGLMQWWLAEKGADVISADRLNRRHMPLHLRWQYRVQGWHQADLAPLPKAVVAKLLPPASPRLWHNYPQKLAATLRQVVGSRPRSSPQEGTVFIYQQDLACLSDIPENSVDAVVSISALEHNPPDKLRACVQELTRVLKPGSKLVVTLAAAKEQDRYHEPSKGWCYTESTLRSVFGLPSDCQSNYEHYDEYFEQLQDCGELRDNLAGFYFNSGDNGMPWGIWRPQYQPVGVVKIKNR